MHIVRHVSQDKFAVNVVVQLADEELTMSDHELMSIDRTFGYWGGEVIERRHGLKTTTMYALVRLYKE